MSHFGVLSFKGTGHLNPLIALSRGLTARGHRVTFLPAARDRRCSAPIRTGVRSDRQEHSLRMDYQAQNQSSVTSAISSLRLRLQRFIAEMEESLSETPSAIKQAGIDALIIDEIVLSGPTLAQLLHVPYFLISTSVPHNVGWSVPRGWSGYKSGFSLLPWLENVLLEVLGA